MKLTVVIPTYNRCERLGQTLRALLDQSAALDSYEIVVADDGSTDETAQVVADVGAPESRLRYFRQENRGPSAARNLGAREARGRVVLFTGDDCLPDRRLVEEHLRAHERNGDVGVVGHVAWHPELTVTPLMLWLDQGPQFGFGHIDDPADAGAWVFYTANCSVQRHWIEELGGFDEEFRYAAYEDIELAYRMERQGLRIVYHPAAVTYHHHAPTLAGHLRRQRLCGRAAALFWRKHPELKEELGIIEAARTSTLLKLYEAASGYAHALGVREELSGEQGAAAESDALSDDPELAESGRGWLRDVFGEADPDKEELIRLRAELYRMRQQWERVTARRLYRWSERLAEAGWRLLRIVGFGRGAGKS